MHGEIHLEQGHLEKASEYLQAAFDACKPVRIQEYILQRSKVLLALGQLAEQQNDIGVAKEYYRMAFDELLETAREFPWNTLLKSILADDIDAAGLGLTAFHESQGNHAEVDVVRTTLERVQTAKAFAKECSSLSNEGAELALRNYRNTTTYLATLRYDLYWQWGVGTDGFEQRWNEMLQERKLKPRYRQELDRQLKSSRTEIEDKITRLEGEAEGYIADLRLLDPEVAAIIEM